MQVREASVEELPTVVDTLWMPLAREMAELPGGDEPLPHARDIVLEHLGDGMAAGRYAVLVAKVHGQDAGMAVLQKRDPPPIYGGPPEAHIQAIFVHPEHRRAGIATSLMEAAQAWGRARGADRVTLNVAHANDAARRFYAELGYGPSSHELTRHL